MASIKHLFETRVKDQGERPTCVAFAASALHEYWREIATAQKSHIGLDLSEEFLYYGCKRRDGLSRRANGTTVSAASSSLRIDGQCKEALHPYRAQAGLLVVPSVKAVTDAATRKLNSLKSQPLKLETIAEFLAKDLPVVGVIETFKSAYAPGAGGMLAMATPGERRRGLHAVLIVAFEGGPTDPVTVFLNSWGSGWGDKGFGRFSKDYFSKHCKQLWSL